MIKKPKKIVQVSNRIISARVKEWFFSKDHQTEQQNFIRWGFSDEEDELVRMFKMNS